MESDFPRFEFGMRASTILNKTVFSEFLLQAWSLIQALGSSSFLTEAVLYLRQADSIVLGIPAAHHKISTVADILEYFKSSHPNTH
jgi:hypothetical protein